MCAPFGVHSTDPRDPAHALSSRDASSSVYNGKPYNTGRFVGLAASDHAYCQSWACDPSICRAQCDGGAGMNRKIPALGAAAALCCLLTVALHAQFGGSQEPPYSPAKDAKDLRAVLFNWTWYMGMLRGIDEHELMVSLEYQANAGSVQVDGQPCTLTKYRASINYQTPGERVQYTCTRANGQPYSNIEVVSGQYAW